MSNILICIGSDLIIMIVLSYEIYIPYFLDYFLRVLFISDQTYMRVQYRGGNKTRAGSINFSLVWRHSGHKCAIEMHMTDVFVRHKY